jgi:hypothetical protein
VLLLDATPTRTIRPQRCNLMAARESNVHGDHSRSAGCVSVKEPAMNILRLAAVAAAASLAFASAHAGMHSGTGGHFGGGHVGGGHFAGQPGVQHFNGTVGAFPHHGGFGHDGFRHDGFRHDGFRHDGFRHDGFRHDGRFVHAFRGGHVGWWFVAGGFWYPWYAAPVPVYANAWYYCPSAAAYYPAVTVCPEGWVLVTPDAPIL